MWEHFDKFLVLLEKHLGKTTANIIKWFILIGAGIVGILWISVFVVDKLKELGSALNIRIIPSQLNIYSGIFTQLEFAILITILYFAILAGIAFVIAVFISTISNIVFSPFTTRRIDNIFSKLLPIVKNVNIVSPTDETKEILDESQKLFQNWNKSRLNNLIRRTTQKRTRDMYDRRKL